jgi:hypothetical protein
MANKSPVRSKPASRVLKTVALLQRQQSLLQIDASVSQSLMQAGTDTSGSS